MYSRCPQSQTVVWVSPVSGSVKLASRLTTVFTTTGSIGAVIGPLGKKGLPLVKKKVV